MGKTFDLIVVFISLALLILMYFVMPVYFKPTLTLPSFYALGIYYVLVSFGSIVSISLISLVFGLNSKIVIASQIIILICICGLIFAPGLWVMGIIILIATRFIIPAAILLASIGFFLASRSRHGVLKILPVVLLFVVVIIPTIWIIIAGINTCSFGTDFTCIERQVVENNDESICQNLITQREQDSCFCDVAPYVDKRALCSNCYEFHRNKYSLNTHRDRGIICFQGTTKNVETDQSFIDSLYQRAIETPSENSLGILGPFVDCYETFGGKYNDVKTCLLNINLGRDRNGWPVLWDLGNQGADLISCQDTGEPLKRGSCVQEFISSV